jgi:hypothetical protein
MLKPRTKNEQINDLFIMAVRWRRDLSRYVTGDEDDYLAEDLEESIETQMWPHLRAITKDDDEFQKCGAPIWDQTTILRLYIRQRKLERIIETSGRKAMWNFWRWAYYD